MTQTGAKITKQPGTDLYPRPVVMVTCVDKSQRPNIITLAWVGVVCSQPPQLSISVRPHRYSHSLIEKSGQFVVNVPSEELVHATDLCGTISGQDFDKFVEAGLTPQPATRVSPPLIAECPVNLECLVRHQLSLGSHDLFIGEVVVAHISEDILKESGTIDFGKARPLTYNAREYWGLGQMLEVHGFSARSRPK